MAYLGNAPARSFISFERQVFTIVNSQTAYTLDHSVNNENDIRLVINNIVQEPGSGKAYTASGTTLTLSAALTNGTDEMYCVFLGRAVATNAPGAGSVGTSQLASDAVTEAKIADDAVESEHLNDNVISGQTELATAPASTDELLISDAGVLKRVDVSLVGGNNTPAFLATCESTQTISHNVFTKIQFAVEKFDSDGTYDNATNYRWTPGVVGKYVIGFAGWFYDANDALSSVVFSIYKNGSASTYFQSRLNSSTAQWQRFWLSGVHPIDVTSTSDYYEAYVEINTTDGGSVDFNSSSSNFRNYFYGYKLIGA